LFLVQRLYSAGRCGVNYYRSPAAAEGSRSAGSNRPGCAGAGARRGRASPRAST